MSSTLKEKAVVGRSIVFTYYREMGQADSTTYPGIITGTEPGCNGGLLARVRLDGKRSNLSVPVGYEGLRYLDEVVPVPELPMGPFIPVADDRNGFYERAGVLLAPIGEDGELVIITDDAAKARAAAVAYDAEIGVDVDFVDYGALLPRWAVFEWEPEDAESPWAVRWVDEKTDENALHIYYLPA